MPRPRLSRARVAPLAAALLVLAAAPLPTALGADDPATTGPQVVAVETTEPEVVVEPPVDVPDAVRRQGARDARTSAAAAAAEGGVPSLHSRPGSERTLLLDFDGQVVSGSRWTTNQGLPDPYVAEPWSLDSDPAISVTEAARIREVWAVVAEDYAPFDIDVTTVDPGTEALARTSSTDRRFGVRALLSDSDAWRQVCQGSRCGGVAYMDVFDDVGGAAFQPAWVFPQNVADDAKIMGDAVSHEVGHTLGLTHDGTASPQKEYYAGQGVWGPIMGAAGNQPLTQWSNGDYTSASNRQDDVALIAAGGAPLLPDDAGDSAAAAATGLPATGLIGTRDDTDWFRLSRCTGDIAVSASPSSSAPDLDLSLELRDLAGTVLDRDDPMSARTSSGSRTLTGLGARVEATGVSTLSSDYLVRVDGVGAGSPLATGYSDYGSLGQYALGLSGLCQSAAGLPAAPRDLRASVLSGSSVTVGWSAPEANGSAPVTGYRVTASPGGTTLTTGPDGRSVTFVGLSRGTAYTFSAVATNSDGNSTASQVGASTPASTPSAVAKVDLALSGAQVVLTWEPPADDGGSPVTGYRVRIASIDQTYAADVGSLTVTGLRGDVTGLVTPVNAVGEGVSTSRSLSVPGTGPAAAAPVAVGAAHLTAKVRPSLAGKPAVGRVLRVKPGSWSSPVTLAYRWTLGSRVLSRAATYRPTRELAGRRLTLRITATTDFVAPVVVTLRVPPVAG